MKKIYIPLIAYLIFALSIGCKVDTIDSSLSQAAPNLVALTVNPVNPSIAPNTALQLDAVGTFSNGSNRNVTEEVVWDSANPSVATVTGTGMVQAVSPGPASALITATSGSVTGSAFVTVSPVASLSVTPADPAMAPGTSQQLTAAGILQNSATQDLSSFSQWSSSDAVIASISNTGVVSTGTAGTGTSVITAEFSGVSGTALLTSSAVRSVTVTPAEAKITQGQTQQFTAIGTLFNGREQNVTDFAAWSLDPSPVGVISGRGLALSTASGAALVTASLGNASGSAVLRATAPPSVVSITVTPSRQSLNPGATRRFSARADFSDGTDRDVTAEAVWSSSNSSVAKISNAAGSKGVLTALFAGTSLITASFSGILSDESVVTVASATAPPHSLIITPADPFVTAGNTVQLRAALIFSDGTIQEVLAAVWSSSNSNVAFVSQGFATGLTAGTTTVTAADGNFTASVVLTVTPF